MPRGRTWAVSNSDGHLAAIAACYRPRPRQRAALKGVLSGLDATGWRSGSASCRVAPPNAATWSWTFYFRTVDFFAGADLLRGAPFAVGGLRASLAALPAWNRTALLAAILMVSPLCGFRPSRAGRAATLKVPRPETRTASPATRESRIAFTTAFTACPAAAWFSSVARATFSISSDWFISDLQLHRSYGTPNRARTSSVLSRSMNHSLRFPVRH
jgi:hypothetical protein